MPTVPIGSLNRWVVEQGRLLLSPSHGEPQLLCCWAAGSRQRWGYDTSQHLPDLLLGQRGRLDAIKPAGFFIEWQHLHRPGAIAAHCGEQIEGAGAGGLKASLNALANRAAIRQQILEPAFHRCALQGVRTQARWQRQRQRAELA
ncbi:hypothetical protein BM449_04850 [Synechococcus sp. SynAce01]|nr:hypothetical protein BM449_04850 [Synechococcus sp. SynAce01]MCT4366002.1 hypothetical protein [Candidatus Regnicoccus frigidus MAG-AL1]